MLDSVWDMQMWDTDNDNEKLVLVHCGSNDTRYAYFYRYQVDTQTFFPAQEVFETPAYQDLIDKNFLSSVELEAGRKMFDDCRKWWGNQVLIYVLSSDDTFEVCLSELVLVNCEEATFNGSEFRRLMYRWNGKRFTLQQ